MCNLGLEDIFLNKTENIEGIRKGERYLTIHDILFMAKLQNLITYGQNLTVEKQKWQFVTNTYNICEEKN